MSAARDRHLPLDLPTGPATYRIWRRLDVFAFAWMRGRQEHARHALDWARHEHARVKLRGFDFALDRYELVLVGAQRSVDALVDTFEVQLEGIASLLSPQATRAFIGRRRVRPLPTSACAQRVLERIAHRKALRARNLDLEGAAWNLAL